MEITVIAGQCEDPDSYRGESEEMEPSALIMSNSQVEMSRSVKGAFRGDEVGVILFCRGVA